MAFGTLANRAKAVGRSLLWSTKCGQDRGVLQSLAAALTEMRTHRVGGVADQNDRTLRPDAGLVTVVQVIAEDDVGSVAASSAGMGSAHDPNLVFKYSSSPGDATRPSFARSVANQ